MQFNNLDKDEGLANLELHLMDNSYITGYELSDSDRKVFSQLNPDKLKDYYNIKRWYKHVKSFDSNNSKVSNKQQDDDDDDLDLFGSDDEEVNEEAEKLKQQRLAEYAAKKATKPQVIAKSMITFDVKPWDDQTDMAAMEKCVRSIEMDGLLWGKSQLVPVGYGIKKLRIACVVEDAKVSTDILEEMVTGFEDYVQSIDIEAFAKI